MPMHFIHTIRHIGRIALIDVYAFIFIIEILVANDRQKCNSVIWI